MKLRKTRASQEIRKAVEVTRAELEDAVRGIDARAELRDRAGDTVSKGRKKVKGTSRKAKRRAAKARKIIEKALPDLPSGVSVTRRDPKPKRGKAPLLVILLGAGGALVASRRKKGA